MGNPLQEGISAARAGQKARAYQLLTRATQDPSSAEHAWLWLSGVIEREDERLFCLDNVLRLNPNNDPAKRGATMLRQKGIFPSPPMPPEEPRQVPLSENLPATGQSSRVQPFLSSPVQASRPNVQSAPASQAPSRELRDKAEFEQQLSANVKYVAMELGNNKTPETIVKELIGKGVSPGNAKLIVSETQKLVRSTRGDKYKKRMTRGLLWTIPGIVVTCATYAFAEDLGGRFVLCYGAIILGVIDFLAGLFGWIFSK